MKIFTQSTTDHRIILTEDDIINMINEKLADRGMEVPPLAAIQMDRRYADDEFCVIVTWSKIKDESNFSEVA